MLVFGFVVFGNLYYGLDIKSPLPDTVKKDLFGSSIKWLIKRSFSEFLSFFLTFSHFLSSQTPSEDDNSEDEWLILFSP